MKQLLNPTYRQFSGFLDSQEEPSLHRILPFQKPAYRPQLSTMETSVQNQNRSLADSTFQPNQLEHYKR